MEVIATALANEANARKTALDKTKELLKRVDWFRTAKLAGTAAALFMGVPPIALAGEILDLGKKLIAGEITGDELAKLESKVTQATAAAAGLLKPEADTSPPKEIHAIRKCFEDALKEMGVTLVVLIDDLDRCLPPTTIATLEAIRLFLFLENTAFVIAADDAMIKHAVRKHFDGVDDKLVTNYFDKLIQVPIRVPPLGTQEVRAYMMLLFVENSTLAAPEEKDPSAQESAHSSRRPGAAAASIVRSWQRCTRTFRPSWSRVSTGQTGLPLDDDRLADRRQSRG